MEAGFTSSAVFNRDFKETFDVTSSQYRKEYQHAISQQVRELCGQKYLDTFWDRWEENHLREENIKLMAKMSFNCVRVVLYANALLYEEPGIHYNEGGFGRLANVIDWCEKYKLYVILDMHGIVVSVNVGMADLVEALRWVRDNIACFGGDPDNVTIFGQSGGGGKVTVLGQIPEAEGLFHKMIVMSGVIPADDFNTDCSPKELVLEILKNLHIDEKDVEKLEKVLVPQYIWAVNKAVRAMAKQGKRVNWSPKPNDYYTCDPLEGDFSTSSLKVPTIVGSVLAEFGEVHDYGDREKLTVAERECLVKEYYGEEILAAFRKAYPDINEVYANDLEVMFLPGTVEYVKKKAAEASAPVYNYLFAKVFDYDGGLPRKQHPIYRPPSAPV